MAPFVDTFKTSASKSTTSIPDPPAAPSSNEPAPITCTRIDFPAYNLPEYADRYGLVLDNLFTEEDYSGKIVHGDPELCAWILTKVRPYLQDIDTIDAHMHKRLRRARVKLPQLLVDSGPGTATISRLRELQFLRYGTGHFFKRHGDGTHISEDEKEISYYTLQLYLNGDSATLKGGATRFWPNPRLRKGSKVGEGVYVDVEPRMGRVLIFEQGDLIHSGEEVTAGIKYNIRADVMYLENPPQCAVTSISLNAEYICRRDLEEAND
ncbi:hypothetical protein PILCRDRAFT_86424 [Piloderma croceum F 1598]|uniref:Prolyl 4-hydroxylase alpha subunit domain-containing protein n=1 Tax=Piloderma croceum (strain F 1598) TaxID=765440 RepID=A0A0C3CAS0_PILCF|nr:hypothetical protein PILCRDRAFT_86424 [Piloderma croceum F 1598]